MKDDQTYAGKSAYHGQVAANYEKDRVSEPIWAQEQDWMKQWAQTIPSGARVLDIPTGTGRFVGLFRERGAKVHAVDVSNDMLAEVRRCHSPDGESLFIERGDAEALSYKSGTFEFVVSWRLFHLLPPAAAKRVLSEFARVCKGTILVEVLGVDTSGTLRGYWRAARRWVTAHFRSKNAETRPWGHIANYIHRDRDLRALFAECGLRLIGVQTLATNQESHAHIYLLRSKEETG